MHKITWANVKSGIFIHSRTYHSALSGPIIKNAHLSTAVRGTYERRMSLKNNPTAPAVQKLNSITKEMANSEVNSVTARKELYKTSFCLAKFSCEVTNENVFGSSVCWMPPDEGT